MLDATSTRHDAHARSPAQENKPAEKRKPDYEVYEEDDEFEEFAQDNWDAAAEDAEDPKLWQDDWDDDDVTGDFSQALRAEIAKTKAAAGK